MFKHILTATDGSDWALKGVKMAIDLATRLGSKLSVVHAPELYPDLIYAEGFISADVHRASRIAAEERANKIFDGIRKEIADRPLMPNFIFCPDSSPANAIDTKAEALGCDLIVIGSRGRRGITKMILGSQAAEVLAGTKLPVLIVK